MTTPIGTVVLWEQHGAIVALRWADDDVAVDSPAVAAPLRSACRQLREYFNEARTLFDLPLKPLGTSFQRRVWSALAAIPHGQTRTYRALASALGTSPRAIGRACGANPIPILIPCHRVVASASDGGFSAPGGLRTKVALLTHEGRPTQLQLLGDSADSR